MNEDQYRKRIDIYLNRYFEIDREVWSSKYGLNKNN